MRIIAGKMKGRKLFTPEDDTIRPTSDRARESIFNLLMHGQFGGDNIIDQPVMDLCSGTGALGLEAISRGASQCTFIDISKKSIELAKQNALHCQVANQCYFVQADVTKLPPSNNPVSLVLMDAPYAKNLLPAAYAGLQKGWLAKDSLLVVELPRDAVIPELAGAELITSRNYGKATVHIWRIN
jgi:16S rRNA (guanine966-N2)-methyltransferase